MSKLFDTLEQIRKNETAQLTKPASAPQRKSRKKTDRPKFAGIVLIVAVAGTLLYFSFPWLTVDLPQKITTIFNKQRPASTIAQKTPVPMPTVSETATETARAELSQTTVSTASKKMQRPASISPSPSVTKADSTSQKFLELNNHGAELVKNEHYWEGIFYLSKANALQPERIEPLINMAVALSELGLSGPAARYFHEAMKIDANNPKIMQSLATLREANIYGGAE